MDVVNKITAEINNLFDSNQSLVESTSIDSINVKAFESRESLINKLTDLLEALESLYDRVETMLGKTKATHAKELAAMDSLLNKMKRPNPTEHTECSSWATVTKKKPVEPPAPSRTKPPQRSYASATATNLAITPQQKTTTSSFAPTPYRVKFTEALSLPALKVPTFDYVKQDGELYYVECADHFAFKLAGQLLHGNIGVIYTEEKNPEKIKDCKFATSCMKQDRCDYYHDPVNFPGSKDHRNFIASSWLYAPPNSQFKNRPRSRRFGSREHLDTDIVGLQPEEISRFHDQTMHDLLCSLLLNDTRAQK